MTHRGDPKVHSAERLGDDFRKIGGIGRAFEQRLWNAGIFSYSELAQRTPEDLAAILAPMAGISPERIASQARDLAGPLSEPSAPRQHYAAFHVEFLLESDNSVRRTKVRQHQTDAKDMWHGWDEERLLSFLRDRIPLPGATMGADADGTESAETQASDQAAIAAEPAQLAGQSLATVSGRQPSWSLNIEELAPMCAGERTHILRSSEPSSAHLTMRLNSIGTPSHDTFDYSATIVARTFGGHERSALGTRRGTGRVSDPVSVEVTGPPLPADLYRLMATVDIYPAGHVSDEQPLYRKHASGDLMQVADAKQEAAAVA